MTIAFVILIVLFLLACLVGYVGYVVLNSEVDTERSRADWNDRNTARYQDLAEELDNERAKLSDELSDAIRLRNEATQVYSEQAVRLNEVTKALTHEQAKRAEVEATYDEYRTRVNTAINNLIGDR